jgi:hypothetical protein
LLLGRHSADNGLVAAGKNAASAEWHEAKGQAMRKCNRCEREIPEDCPQQIKSCGDYAEWCERELAEGRYDLGLHDSPEMLQIVLGMLVQVCEEKCATLWIASSPAYPARGAQRRA